MRKVEIIGGGLAGLVAAIECAERGLEVSLFEATKRLGGRARSLEREGFVTNQGPHALYRNGPAWEWLRERELLPQTVGVSISGFRFLHDGKLERFPRPLLRAFRKLRQSAPDEVDFASWARDRAGVAAARAAIGYLSLPLFDPDPGRLNARLGQETLIRSSKPGTVRYVIGGWSVLVAKIAGRARELGVSIETDARITTVESEPTIVATGPMAAAKLLDDPSLLPPRRQVALLDLGLASGNGPSAVLDLDQGVYLVRSSAVDRTIVPEGQELIQCSAPIREGEKAAEAHARGESLLNQACPGWDSEPTFVRHTPVAAPGTVDLPGTSWEDRSPVNYRTGLFLAGDYVAAPGLLSEISFMSARRAAISAAGPAKQTISVAARV